MIYVENSKTGWATLTYRIHREDTDGQWAPSSVIYKRPGIRRQYDRLRSVEGGCGEEREGLGRRATFQGRGRSNVIETSVRVRANETARERGRVKLPASGWSIERLDGAFSKGTEVRMATSVERGRRCELSAPGEWLETQRTLFFSFFKLSFRLTLTSGRLN